MLGLCILHNSRNQDTSLADGIQDLHTHCARFAATYQQLDIPPIAVDYVGVVEVALAVVGGRLEAVGGEQVASRAGCGHHLKRLRKILQQGNYNNYAWAWKENCRTNSKAVS